MMEMQPVSDRIPNFSANQSARESRQLDPGFPVIPVASLTCVRDGLTPLHSMVLPVTAKLCPLRAFTVACSSFWE
jgi:hypothetical protein